MVYRYIVYLLGQIKPASSISCCFLWWIIMQCKHWWGDKKETEERRQRSIRGWNRERERARDRDCAYREKERRRVGEAARRAVKVERVNEIPLRQALKMLQPFRRTLRIWRAEPLQADPVPSYTPADCVGVAAIGRWLMETNEILPCLRSVRARKKNC